MVSLLWKMRLAVLWVIVAVGMSAGMFLALLSPDVLSEAMEGRVGETEITASLLILFSLFWLVPLAMAFLTLVLRDPVNRWTNAAVGVVITGMWAWDLIEHLTAGDEFSGESFVVVAIILAGLTILWHTWKWPEVRHEEPLVEEAPIPAGTAATRR